MWDKEEVAGGVEVLIRRRNQVHRLQREVCQQETFKESEWKGMEGPAMDQWEPVGADKAKMGVTAYVTQHIIRLSWLPLRAILINR